MTTDGRVSMDKKLDAQRLGALFVAGWLLLNFPLLGLFDAPVSLLGMPALWLALFLLWALLIAGTAWLVERAGLAQGDD